MKKYVKSVILSVLFLALGVCTGAYAATSYTVKSNGIFRYDGNGDGDCADSQDVVFDSNDLHTINNQVVTLSTGLDSCKSQLQSVSADVAQLGEDVSLVADSLGNLRFGVDDSGSYGYYGSDGSLVPFKSSNARETGYLTFQWIEHSYYVSQCYVPVAGFSKISIYKDNEHVDVYSEDGSTLLLSVSTTPQELDVSGHNVLLIKGGKTSAKFDRFYIKFIP